MYTVNRLYKELGKLIEQGHGRKHVYINKDTFTHPLEGDGCVILPVESVDMEWYPILDGDGGTKLKANGEECARESLVLKGECEC